MLVVFTCSPKDKGLAQSSSASMQDETEAAASTHAACLGQKGMGVDLHACAQLIFPVHPIPVYRILCYNQH